MSGEPFCFNCGAPTDLVTEGGDAICRTCLEARQPPAPADAEEPEPKPKAKAAGVKRG